MATSKARRAPRVVGWHEYVDLPAWGIHALRAKADTGARSSALHVENIRLVGARRIRFDVVLSRTRRTRHLEARVSRVGRVRSSSGQYARRFFVTTTVRVGPVEREVELSLVDREKMIYRMLLGRTALTGLLVNPGRGLLLSERPHPRRAQRPRSKGRTREGRTQRE